MDSNENLYPEERRAATDRRESSITAEATIWVLRTKVDMLTVSLSDIKDTLKRIVDIVGVISIIEVNAKQLSKESTSLQTALDDLAEQVAKLEKSIDEDIQDSANSLGKKHSELQAEVAKLRTFWEEKYNIARGMWIVVSAIMALTASGVFMYFKSYTVRIDEAYSWIERYKIEKSIRDHTPRQAPTETDSHGL